MVKLLLQTLLVIGSFVPAACTAVGPEIKPPTPPKPRDEVNCGLSQDELVNLTKLHNANRLKVAEEKQIANMHEIRYNSDLEGYLSCYKSENQCQTTDTLETESGKIHPLQTEFAFCDTTTYYLGTIKIPGMDKPSLHWWSARSRRVVFAPKNTEAESEVKHGPPGSQCPNGKAASGLCKASWNTEPTLPDVPPPTIQPAVETENGTRVTYSFCLIFLLILLVQQF
ncbi:unnamed protein product [Caenorhabditis brenneri]